MPLTRRHKATTAPRNYYIYIMASWSKVLYVGVTNDLQRRVNEHKGRRVPGFTKKYHVTQLVYFETTSDVRVAIEREKRVKAWGREKKVKLIQASYPEWRDLSEEWMAG